MPTSPKNYYGSRTRQQIETLIHKVCFIFDPQNWIDAENQINEIVAVESAYGTIKPGNRSGHGIAQTDLIQLQDIQQNSLEYRTFVLQNFGFDILDLTLKDLDEDEEKSIVVCRLTMKRDNKPIETTRLGRAKWWKERYNTEAGSGSVEHYMKMCEDLGVLNIIDLAHKTDDTVSEYFKKNIPASDIHGVLKPIYNTERERYISNHRIPPDDKILDNDTSVLIEKSYVNNDVWYDPIEYISDTHIGNKASFIRQRIQIAISQHIKEYGTHPTEIHISPDMKIDLECAGMHNETYNGLNVVYKEWMPFGKVEVK